jgi:DNA recombination protein Rad52
MIDNARNRGQAFEKAKKEAVTDALKRCLRAFGNAMGNCLYDKTFLRNIQKCSAQVTSISIFIIISNLQISMKPLY